MHTRYWACVADVWPFWLWETYLSMVYDVNYVFYCCFSVSSLSFYNRSKVCTVLHYVEPCFLHILHLIEHERGSVGLISWSTRLPFIAVLLPGVTWVGIRASASGSCYWLSAFRSHWVRVVTGLLVSFPCDYTFGVTFAILGFPLHSTELCGNFPIWTLFDQFILLFYTPHHSFIWANLSHSDLCGSPIGLFVHMCYHV